MRTRSLRPSVAVFAALVVVAAPGAFASDDVQTSFESARTGRAPLAAAATESQTWFVEMQSSPTADGTSASEVKSEHAAFRAEAKTAGIKFGERYSFEKLWNGLAVNASPAAASALSLLPSVKSLSPVGTFQPPPEETATPDLATAITMTGADVVQDDLGFDGFGVRVAIMDTGLDYDHPDLGGDGVDSDAASDDGAFDANFPNSRVVGGWDFVGDDFNAVETSPGYQPVPHPDPDPDDCFGHGTHVAGILGADGDPATGGARGVAPGATIRAYRVVGCSGGTSDDVLLAAMERVLADGADVLNISIGDPFDNWPGSPTAQAADRLVNNGVVVVASIGNSGLNGVYSAGTPGSGKKVIGVGSYENSHIRAPGFTISPDDLGIAYIDSASSVTGVPDPPDPPTSGTYDVRETPAGDAVGTVPPGALPAADGCAAFPAGYFSGKVALIRRGTCSFTVKAQNAQAAGAVAVVLYNNVAAGLRPTVAAAISIPVVLVSKSDGELIHNRLVSDPVSLTWHAEVTAVNETGGLISVFSSYGTAADLSLKPDLGAPGGFIRSTWPLEKGSYLTMSGSSMASPHVAGAVALLLEAFPHTSPQAVRSILQNTAQPAVWSGNPALGVLDVVYRQGAGMLRIDRAIQATARVTPGKLSLGESEAGPQTSTLTVRNDGAAPITYDLASQDAISTFRTFPVSGQLGFELGTSDVEFTQAGVPVTSVTVPGGGEAQVDVTISPDPALAPRSLYGGYLYFVPQGGGYTLHVPFAGFAGDYQTIQALTSGDAGLPKLARHVDYLVSATEWKPKYEPQVGTPTYTMGSTADPDAGNRAIRDIPFVAIHFDHQVRTLKAEVSQAATDKRVGVAFDLDYLPRNDVATASFADSTGFTAFGWNGKVRKGNATVDVADGAYYLKLTALEALGDPANPADLETLTSPLFTIDRP